MTLTETMAELKKLGNPKAVETYRRHGAPANCFGVRFSDLGKLVKRIKRDHKLARGLWKTGNVDARTLALMIADPGQLTEEEADRWIEEADYKMYAYYLAPLAARSAHGAALARKWTASKNPIAAESGWNILGARLKDDPHSLSDAEAGKALARIEREIDGAADRAKYAMNNALIAIGIWKPSLREKAIASARRIGKVVVDHGDTDCKTPDAEPYILKAAARGAKKAKRRT